MTPQLNATHRLRTSSSPDTISAQAAPAGGLRCSPTFPPRTLLESGKLPIAEIALLALREGQCSTPLYRVHRWFARRLGSQFRAILTGLSLPSGQSGRFWDVYLKELSLEGVVVLDPFVGGGTGLVEAAQSGASVIGYDIDPVASFIARFELDIHAYDPQSSDITDVCASVSERIRPLHVTLVPGLGRRVVLHHFWVECRTCRACGASFEIHPHYQLAYSIEKQVQWVFCRGCHDVFELPITRKEIRCACGTRTAISQGSLSQGKVHCPACGSVSGLGERGQFPRRPEWRLFAQEYLEEGPTGVSRHFKRATSGDQRRYGRARRELEDLERTVGCFAPGRVIPSDGRSDQRPLIHGFRRYRDLFNDRQLLHLSLLGAAIGNVEDPRSRRLLALAFSEHLTANCVYTSYAFGYRRVSPLFSIHSYRHITRPVELNPWLARIGRGTFPNALAKISRASEFARTPTALAPDGGRRTIPPLTGSSRGITTPPSLVLSGKSRASIVTHTSEALKSIPDASIDLVLTDPPYFDNLSYSELSDFYLAWHQALGIAEGPYRDSTKSAPMEGNLALTNRADQSIEEYRRRLQRVFSECARVLKRGGVLVFTYHHRSPLAWCALGEALTRNPLKCTSVLPLRGEGQGGLHSYDGTIKWDAVFCCRKTRSVPTGNAPVVVSKAAVRVARRRAAAFAKELARPRKIGFREPDRLNLERALIVGSAFTGRETRSRIDLRRALEMKELSGDRAHAQAR